MAAPDGVGASQRALRLVLACATVAFLFVLSCCSPSSNKQSNAASGPAAGTSPAASPETAPSSTPPVASSTTGPSPAASSGQPGAAPSGGDTVDIGSITIESEDGANKGAPITLDLVFVYDASLIPQIESESAETWFKGKAALAASAGTNLSVMSWTIAPGDEVPETAVDVRPGALAAFVFAHYTGKGDHRLRIDGSGALTVTLEANDPSFEVEQ